MEIFSWAPHSVPGERSEDEGEGEGEREKERGREEEGEKGKGIKGRRRREIDGERTEKMLGGGGRCMK